MQTDLFLSQLIQLSQLRLKREQPRQAPSKKTDRYAYATAAKGYGCRMALMGFDFTDLEEKRRKFQWWLESQGVDSDTAYSEAMRLEHSWEFAAYEYCPTGKGGGIDPTCSPTGEPAGWFHGTHADLKELKSRSVETIDSIGTWVTSSSTHARTLYGPNVHNVLGGKNLLEAHTDNFDDFFFNNRNLFKETFPNEPVKTLEKFKDKGLARSDKRAFAMRTTYLRAFRSMLEKAGYDGIVWRGSRIDLRKSDAPHDVAVLFKAQKG